MQLKKEFALAIIGGGRWAQVIIDVLSKMKVPVDRIVVVSRINHNTIKQKLLTMNYCSVPFSSVLSTEEAFDHYHVRAAIIVNAAREHFKTALYCINRGTHVLIEKPAVLALKEMYSLINDAIRHNVILLPGLTYRFCSYLTYFAEYIIASKNKKLDYFSIEWMDGVGELRYGQIKKHDSNLNVAQEVMPHIWTILKIIFGNPILTACEKNNCSENEVNFKVSTQKASGRILLQRHAQKRKRLIQCVFHSGEQLSIDFSVEPGKIFSNQQSVSADPDWQTKLSPLTLQFNYFFSLVLKNERQEPDMQAALSSVSFTEQASELLEKNGKFYVSKIPA